MNKIWLIKLIADSEHFVKRVQYVIKVVIFVDWGMLVFYRVMIFGRLNVCLGVEIITLKL